MPWRQDCWQAVVQAAHSRAEIYRPRRRALLLRPQRQAAAAEKPEVSHDEEMTFEIYDAAANYQGEQTGWFAKVLKDNLNIKVNIVAPQVAGDAVYQTRASSGNLGDIVILDGTQFNDCLSAGLVKDISADIYKYPNLAAYKKQIDVFNESLDGIQKGQIYGIPCQMTDTSPLTYSGTLVYSAPLLRWDRYKEIGEPDIKDLDGLLDALEAIHHLVRREDQGIRYSEERQHLHASH